MARDTRIKKPADPVDAHNAKILADRAARLEDARPELPELGLGLKTQDPEPATAAEFMDVFDKKAFGYEQATITKIIYGPDPLVDNSPGFREAIERYGREDLAHIYKEAILQKGAGAMPDKLMARSLSSAIDKFGRAEVAEAFCNRVLKIKFRQVEIDASDELDPEIMGSAILAETVKRHERPGMEYRFFTQLCVDRMGWRGYTPVREGGDIVRAGSLMLGEMRREQVERRRLKQQQMAQEKLADVGAAYAASAESILENAAREGFNTRGVSALNRDEVVTPKYAGAGGEDYLGQSRNAGVELTRETK